MSWEEEHILLQADHYYNDIIAAFAQAKHSIDVEVYIYKADAIGTRIMAALCDAAKRGVRVRLLTDGFGSIDLSQNFTNQLIQCGGEHRTYHPLWRIWLINKRTHRKLIIVDQSRAWIGSMNITMDHMLTTQGGHGWRDLAVRVIGALGLQVLSNDFEYTWSGKRDKTTPTPNAPQVRLNSTALQRIAAARTLITMINNAQHRIWITSAYFVPRSIVMNAIRKAARRGVDVRVLIPGESDVFFMPWATHAYSLILAAGKTKIYAFKPSMLHTKAILLDQTAIVGSTNLNHRSFIHDLEADVVLLHPATIKTLEDRFKEDLSLSELQTSEVLSRRGWTLRVLARLLNFFRRVL